MVSGTTDLDAAAVLASVRRARATADAAEARVLADAVTWAHLHVVDHLDDAATWWAGRGQDTGIPIGGTGCPLVSEFAVVELAMLELGVFLWRSPYGYTYLRDGSGTDDLTSKPARRPDRPGAAPPDG